MNSKEHPGGRFVIDNSIHKRSKYIAKQYHSSFNSKCKFQIDTIFNGTQMTPLEDEFDKLVDVSSYPFNYWWVAQKFIELFVIFGCMIISKPNYVGQIFFGSLMIIQSAWLGHDAIHNSLIKNRIANRIAGYFLFDFITSISSVYFRHHHLTHHVFLNETHDLDLSTPTLISQNTKYPSLVFILTFPIYSTELLINSIKYNISNYNIEYFIILFIREQILYHITGITFIYRLPMLIISSIFVTFILSLNHLDDISHKDNNCFVKNVFLNTTNFYSSNLFDWLSGDIAYQIEHHLYPSIPRHYYQNIANKVYIKCRDLDIKYKKKTIPTLVYQIIHELDNKKIKPMISS